MPKIFFLALDLERDFLVDLGEPSPSSLYFGLCILQE